MSTAILAVDPGGTTGYSYAIDDVLVDAGQLPPYEFQAYAESFTTQWRADLTLICERFTITQRTIKSSRGGSVEALEIIGCLRYFSLRDCGRDLIHQSPSDVMNLYTDEKLRMLGWYRKGQGHSNDSLRHLAYYLTQQGKLRVPVF